MIDPYDDYLYRSIEEKYDELEELEKIGALPPPKEIPPPDWVWGNDEEHPF